jgi:hypothetical protein
MRVGRKHSGRFVGLPVLLAKRSKAAAQPYFRVTVAQEWPAGKGGFTFARPKTDGPDVISVAAKSQRQSTRRKPEVAA